MKIVRGEALTQIKPYFAAAGQEARRSSCRQASCGSVVVVSGVIIGRGYNSPPLDQESSRFCDAKYDYNQKPKYDKTCCVHAEWRAIIDACKHRPDQLGKSTLYFMRLDEDGGFGVAGQPFCTTCSRLAMESGIAKFALWQGDHATIYVTAEYNAQTYNFYLRPQS